MARRTPEPVQMYRGTTAQHSTYIGPAGELTVDVDKDTVVVHDGSTLGGHPLAKAATTITASNGVQIASGGTLGQNTAISGVDASTTAKGVVQLESAVTGTAGIVPDSAAVKAYADSAGAPYTATAPIEIDATNRVISADDATTAAKGVVQVGTNIDVASGVISVKPWATYKADHSDVVMANIQDGCLVQTDENIGASSAVLAPIENSISGSVSAVPSSYAAKYDKYDLCEFYYFRNPTLRPGFVQAAGALISNAATLYPRAFAFLQTAEGQLLCKTEAEWQAMSTAIYYTDASGNTEGWNGVGGVPFFVINTANGTIRVPDIRGMYAEAAGLDSLAVGGVHADKIRNIYGANSHGVCGTSYDAFTYNHMAKGLANSTVDVERGLVLNASRVVPTGNQTKPRAFGSLACVYLGA